MIYRRGRYFGPNWYASVMGTGIAANAGALLPFDDGTSLSPKFRREITWIKSVSKFLVLRGSHAPIFCHLKMTH